tara:strand:- start:3456 stop:4577 length:1122 start_codon:yes stop_codon:yes gene_type:complete
MEEDDMLEKISKTLSEEVMRFYKRTKNMSRLLADPVGKVGLTPADVVFQRNKMTLLRYEPWEGMQEESETPLPAPRSHPIPVLLVPSVINRHYILDLQPGKSFVEYLVKQGFDVYMMNWGTPGGEDRYQTFDDYIELLIHASVRRIQKLTGAPKIHLVGHCLGGIMTLPYAVLHPERIQTLFNLTTPVDLRHGGILKIWTDSLEVDSFVDAFGNAPWPILQASFHMLKPMGLVQKTAWFYEQLWNDEVIDNFMALETWVNDNVSISGEFYRTYIKEIYQKNALYNGTLVINGEKIDLRKLKMPVMNVAAAGDHIATPPSVLALQDLVPHTHNVTFKGGHIGAVVSRRASKKLWPEITAFFEQHASENAPANGV